MFRKDRISNLVAEEIWLSGDYAALTEYLIPYVHAVLSKRTRQTDQDYQDILQACLLKILSGIHNFKPGRGSRLTSYVFRIIMNEVYTYRGYSLEDYQNLIQAMPDWDLIQDDTEPYGYKPEDLSNLVQLALSECKMKPYERKALRKFHNLLKSKGLRFDNRPDLIRQIGISTFLFGRVLTILRQYHQERNV